MTPSASSTSRPPATKSLRQTAAYDCQARAALRSMLWSIPSRKRIPLREQSQGRISACEDMGMASKSESPSTAWRGQGPERRTPPQMVVAELPGSACSEF